MTYPKLELKRGREKSVLQRHPWIFSGAIAKAYGVKTGDCVRVVDHAGTFLAVAYYNPDTSIAARVIGYRDVPAEELLREKIQAAYDMRRGLINPEITSGYRLVNSEGDGIPGLIVDVYGDVAVLQVETYGIELLKPYIIEQITHLLHPKGIYEKSNSGSRKMEGLQPAEGVLAGTVPAPVRILENNLAFDVEIAQGQKTGFFLDQREMRVLAGSLSAGKRVLNCFGYTGGFSVYAAAGGADSVTTVDISKDACLLAQQNLQINGFEGEGFPVIAQDAFEFLRQDPLDFGLIILDPPAFAKRKSDIQAAARGYKDINFQAIKKAPEGAILITSSCSHFVDDKLFTQIVFSAAADAGREVRIIGKHRQAPDHPVSIYHPEGGYLKSLVLEIR